MWSISRIWLIRTIPSIIPRQISFQCTPFNTSWLICSLLFGDIYSSEAYDSLSSIAGKTNPETVNHLRLYVSYQCSDLFLLLGRYVLYKYGFSIALSELHTLWWVSLCLCPASSYHRKSTRILKDCEHWWIYLHRIRVSRITWMRESADDSWLWVRAIEWYCYFWAYAACR